MVFSKDKKSLSDLRSKMKKGYSPGSLLSHKFFESLRTKPLTASEAAPGEALKQEQDLNGQAEFIQDINNKENQDTADEFLANSLANLSIQPDRQQSSNKRRTHKGSTVEGEADTAAISSLISDTEPSSTTPLRSKKAPAMKFIEQEAYDQSDNANNKAHSRPPLKSIRSRRKNFLL
jgi:hypothetical protein